ncbi:MAG: hypothetical protein HRT36_07850 [Alphaproteobacteria bacterium]|nr:hypothetical protein [Alphaproteobacteria bacterium]
MLDNAGLKGFLAKNFSRPQAAGKLSWCCAVMISFLSGVVVGSLEYPDQAMVIKEGLIGLPGCVSGCLRFRPGIGAMVPGSARRRLMYMSKWWNGSIMKNDWHCIAVNARKSPKVCVKGLVSCGCQLALVTGLHPLADGRSHSQPER